MFVLLMIVGWGSYLYVTADKAATHTTLKQAKLAPLISVNAFHADTKSRWLNQVSFDGRYIADFGTSWGKRVIHIRRVDNPDKVLSTVKMPNMHGFSWDNRKNSILVYSDSRLWEIDAEQSKRANRVDVTPRGFDRWSIVYAPTDTNEDPANNRWIVASNDRNPEFADLFSVRRDGGGKKLLVKNEGKTIGWRVDRYGTPRVRMDRNTEEGLDIYLLGESGDDRLFKTVDVRDTFYFIGQFDEDQPLLAISNVGRDKTALVEVNTDDGSEVVLDVHERVDVGNFWTFKHSSSMVDLVRFFDGYPQLNALTPRGEVVKQLIESLGDHVHIDYVSTSVAGRFLIAEVSVDEKAYQVYLLDLENKAATKIHDANFRRYKDSLSTTEPVNFQASDGTWIQGFLTLPVGVEPASLPAIISVHGGPASQVVWKYDHSDQFLANRGYAVFKINFRGSTGYGKAFRALGYGNFGTSYGGYSSALAMTRDAGTFAAGVVEMAVTDVVYQMDNNPHAWGLHLDEMKRYFGDPANEVGFEQSEEFERALLKSGKQVSAHYPEKMVHGYPRWQDRVTRARLLEDFLAEHLGGRTGGRDWAELAAKYF